MPDSAVERGQAQQAEAQQQAEQTEADVVAQEYQRLSRALGPLQMEAMAAPELRAQWNALVADADARVLARSSFHRGLMDRRAEIERLMEQPDTLTAEQRAELARHYGNIQREMGRVRNEELREPEFYDRFVAFQAALFDRMRELRPEQIYQIDRLQELELQLFVPAESELPVPGMQPIQ